jgi:hypothetical protein
MTIFLCSDECFIIRSFVKILLTLRGVYWEKAEAVAEAVVAEAVVAEAVVAEAVVAEEMEGAEAVAEGAEAVDWSLGGREEKDYPFFLRASAVLFKDALQNTRHC